MKRLIPRSFVPVCAIWVVFAVQAKAESLKKAYFKATPPGSWAQYESTWKMPNGMAGTNVYTYTRAPDNAARIAFELSIETLDGPGKGMISRQLNILAPDFDFAMEFMEYLKFLEAQIAQTNDGAPTVAQDNIIEIMRKAGSDFNNTVTFKGTTERQGRQCDHYAYAYKSGGPHVAICKGEIWLDDTLPFGIVFQKGEVTDESGKQISTFEQKLLDSGTGRICTAALLAMVPKPETSDVPQAAAKAIQTLLLLEAYQREQVRILVDVKKVGGGKHLVLNAVNLTDESIEFVVPKADVKLEAGSPVNILWINFDKKQAFVLAPNETSQAFLAEQKGSRGVIDGKFQLRIYEGEPLFQGTVKIGSL